MSAYLAAVQNDLAYVYPQTPDRYLTGPRGFTFP